MGDREDAKRLRHQAQELLEAAQVKEMRADEEDARREDETVLLAPLLEAVQYVGSTSVGIDDDAVGIEPSARPAAIRIVARILIKAREDGARRQRALIRQEAQQAEDAADFTRWAMELK